MASRLQIQSEVYGETDYQTVSTIDGNSVSKFTFALPSDEVDTSGSTDKDGDLIVARRVPKAIELEHSKSTILPLVGLQVWRGAFLLNDFIIHNRNQFANKTILELGSGVGLTGITAALYCKKVICTDISVGGILEIIESNVQRNKKLIHGEVKVMELDFLSKNWSSELLNEIENVNTILAADVIYDDELTDGLVDTIRKLLMPGKTKRDIYIALEKRYVFTVADLDIVPPCYEYFLAGIEKLRWANGWTVTNIPIDFPQFFNYVRCKELVLLKISN